MSCFWISLSLLYVLLHRVSADAGVKLICNKTVNVQIGHSATLNCSINWTQLEHGQNCKGVSYNWHRTDDDTSDSISCTNGSYICDSDNITYVSLTILNVSKNENYTVGMLSNCGMDMSPSIAVQLDEILPLQEPSTNKTRQREETPSHVTVIVLGVLAAATVVAFLGFLYKWCRTPSNSHQYAVP